jgi:tetratricopeptide (TPR) repeat protein
VKRNFVSALGDGTIGDRIGKPVDRNNQLAGDIWFYYGSRYGEYLSATKQGSPDDFLTAALEQSPASASGYLGLADYYMEIGDTRAAVADYGHTLEMEPNRADVHERMALAYYKQGARAAAIAQWKLVFATLSKEVTAARTEESFWNDFVRSCDDLRTRRLFAELKPDVDGLLRAYLRKSGNYRSNLLLRSGYLGIGGGPVGTAWLIDLASVAPNPTAVLTDVADAPWIPLEQRATIYQKVIDGKQSVVAKTEGLERDSAQEDLFSWQVRWVRYLIQAKRFMEASTFLDSLPEETRKTKAAELIPAELRVAALLATLDQKIAGFHAAPQDAPSSEVLRASARQLAQAGDNPSARKILEFVFAREIDEHHLEATNFLGLAEARIDSGDTPGAVELLRRMPLVVGNPYENLNSAAALLEKTGHNAEALEFLDHLVKSAPWEHSYGLRLAKAEMAASQDVEKSRAALVNIASSADSFYGVRVEAALALAAARGTSSLGSAELNLLAGDTHAISVTAADQPFFSDARMKSAENLTDPRAKLQLLGGALSEFPSRNDVRLAGFRAAATLREDQLSLAVINPFLNLRYPGGPPNRFISEENQGAEANVNIPAGLTAAQWPEIAASVGETMARLDRLNDALRYLNAALRLERAAPRLKELNDEIVLARGQLRREETNLARAPILHEALEQQRVVRPRLVAQQAAPPPAAAERGGQKP